MSQAARLVRTARHRAGLTQAQLAERVGTTQSVIARLERPGSNPRLDTLDDVLHAAGHTLELEARRPKLPEVDETQIVERLRLSPAERLEVFTASQHNLVKMLRTARLVDD